MSPENGVRVYLTPLEDRPLESELMRFRLIYEGELKPSQLDPITGKADKLSGNKHAIRKVMHRQLKALWQKNKFLREHEVYPGDYDVRPSIAEQDLDFGEWSNKKIPLVEAVAAQYHENGYVFVPLVRERWSLRCALNILLLRCDYPGGGVVEAGDLDNRIKTLIDGLRRPKNGGEIREHPVPDADETPFFCLLEDDSQITELRVETDTLLDEPPGADARYAKAIITVEIQPYDVTTFNLAFA